MALDSLVESPRTSDFMTIKPSHSWPYWVLFGAVLLLVVYPLSLGPEEYLIELYPGVIPDWANRADQIIYGPLYLAIENGPEWFRKSMHRYRRWWSSLAHGI